MCLANEKLASNIAALRRDVYRNDSYRDRHSSLSEYGSCARGRFCLPPGLCNSRVFIAFVFRQVLGVEQIVTDAGRTGSETSYTAWNCSVIRGDVASWRVDISVQCAYKWFWKQRNPVQGRHVISALDTDTYYGGMRVADGTLVCNKFAVYCGANRHGRFGCWCSSYQQLWFVSGSVFCHPPRLCTSRVLIAFVCRQILGVKQFLHIRESLYR